MKKSKNIDIAFRRRLKKYVMWSEEWALEVKDEDSETEDDWRLSSYYFQIYLKRYDFLNISIEEMFCKEWTLLAPQLPGTGRGGAQHFPLYNA